MEKSSYEKINYSLRPAKAIERKMLCEAMRRLSMFKNIEKYRYIGFGSTYFSDFTLIHKSLGIKDLISIEQDINNNKRFIFNQPYSCVKILFGQSNKILPTLKWSKPSIVWVDYDKKLNAIMFDDINTFFFSATAGSLFIITVDVKPDDPEEEISEEEREKKILPLEDIKKFRYKKLVERVGDTKIPFGIEKTNLNRTENPKIIYQILNDQIQEIVIKRNGGLSNANKINYKQIFHFVYDDGTLMLTIGGVIYRNNQQQLVEKIKFNDLDFIRTDDIPFTIDVPKLTFKEINALDQLLPERINNLTGKIIRAKNNTLNIPYVPPEDIKKYSKVYRHFPNFAETNF